MTGHPTYAQTGESFCGQRFYCGDFHTRGAWGLPDRGNALYSGDACDALTIRADDVSVDQCSLAWGIDENLGISLANNVRIARCLNMLTLNKNRHPRTVMQDHGCGALVDRATRVLFHECVHAHHWVRGLFDVTVGAEHVEAEAANCIVYNWQREAFKFLPTPAGKAAGSQARVNLRSCLFVVGPDTQRLYPSHFRTEGHPVCIEDCWVLGLDGSLTDLRDHLSERDRAALVSEPHDLRWEGYDPSLLYPARTLIDNVLPIVGPPTLNALERRVINDVRNRSGSIIDTQDQVIGELVEVPEQRVAITRKGYYRVMSGTSELSRHADEAEAYQQALQYTLSGREVSIEPPTRTVEVTA